MWISEIAKWWGMTSRQLHLSARLLNSGYMQQPKIYNIQALRLFAATAVATSHIADLLVPNDSQNAWFWSVPWTAGVDLFFVISGFIMLLVTHGSFGKDGAASHFLLRRAARIVPTYWFFTVVIITAVVLAGGRSKGTTVTLDQIGSSFAFVPWPRGDGKMTPILAQGWTLNYEAFFYVTFAIALLKRRGLTALCIAFCALAAAHPFLPVQLSMLRYWSDPIILEFIAGSGLAKLYLSGFRINGRFAVFTAITAIASYIILAGEDFGPYDRVSIGVPAFMICSIAALIREPQKIGCIRHFIIIGGDASYSLYLSHYAIVNLVAMTWKRLGLHLPWMGVAAGLVVSISFAIWFHIHVERRMTNGFQRLLERCLVSEKV